MSSFTPPCFPYSILGRRWKMPKASFKMELTNKSVDCFVIRVLNINKILFQGLSMHMIVTPQKLNQSTIDYLCLPICLWMEICRPLQLGVDLLSKRSPKWLRNMISLYNMMLPSIPKCTNTFSKNMFVDSFHFMVFLQGIRMHSLLNLSTTKKYIVMLMSLSRCWKTTHNIHGDGILGYNGYR
jgi:hypothetical protein